MYYFIWYLTEYIHTDCGRSLSPQSELGPMDIQDSDLDFENGNMRSVIAATPETTAIMEIPSTDPVSCPQNTDTTAGPSTLSSEILEALGDPKSKDESFGPKIPDEISKRWGRVLVEGLTKEQKLDMIENTQIPDNFRLVKAPILNPEISHILSDPIKNRDKVLEKSQNHLGMGIAGLSTMISAMIDSKTHNIELIKKLSETSQIFLDLHNENTKTRRKLVMSSLDKKFSAVVADVKRDEFLFGADLGEKIKATKSAEKSGLQIKRSEATITRTPKFPVPSQGNWRGPPRGHQAPRGPRQGGPKNRYPPQSTKRQPPPERFYPPKNPNYNKTRKN